MARKLNPKATSATPIAVADPGAEDLSVIYPDVELDLAGRHLTVREYRFIGGLRARALAKPLIDDVATLVETGNAAGASVEDYLDLLAKHGDLVRELMASSIDGADADYIAGLSDADGSVLLMTWWGVAGRFFVRLVLRRIAEQLLAAARRAALAGPTSSPASPPPATAAPTSSAGAAPSVN